MRWPKHCDSEVINPNTLNDINLNELKLNDFQSQKLVKYGPAHFGRIQNARLFSELTRFNRIVNICFIIIVNICFFYSSQVTNIVLMVERKKNSLNISFFYERFLIYLAQIINWLQKSKLWLEIRHWNISLKLF